MAFELAGIEVCRRLCPRRIYRVRTRPLHGRPVRSYALQRIQNFGGIGGMEGSPFGFLPADGAYWPYPFNCLTIRTWRDVAKYKGPEADSKEQ